MERKIHSSQSAGNEQADDGRRRRERIIDDWELYSGLAAAGLALVGHLLGVEVHLLSVTVVLIALYFLRTLRHERYQREQTQLLRSILSIAGSMRQDLLDDIRALQSCSSLASIQARLADALISRRWEEINEALIRLANGSILIRNRKDVFEYKRMALDLLRPGDSFLSTVTPIDMDDMTYTSPGFAAYQQAMLDLQSRSIADLRRLYIFRDEAQREAPTHQNHMQRLAAGGVQVRTIVLARFSGGADRDRVAHADYAIFGERYVARLDPSSGQSAIDTSSDIIGAARKDFESLWREGLDVPGPPSGGRLLTRV